MKTDAGSQLFRMRLKSLAGAMEKTFRRCWGCFHIEEHFRQFVSDKFKIPARNMELLFGRSFARMTTLFGFKVSGGT